MYNGSNIFAKQDSHNLHLEGAHDLFPFKLLHAPRRQAADWGSLWSKVFDMTLLCVCMCVCRRVCVCVCLAMCASPLPNPLLPEVSVHLQRHGELVLNYKQVCFLPSFVLQIIPWVRAVHNKGRNNKPLS